MSVWLKHLKFKDAVKLLAHGTCNEEEVRDMYLTRQEQSAAEVKADETLVQMIFSGELCATALYSDEKKNPIKENWKSQQFKKAKAERVPICLGNVSDIHSNKVGSLWYSFSDNKYIRTPKGQYSDIFIELESYEKVFDTQVLFGRGQKANDASENSYLSPYIQLMLEAIEHFDITEKNQPLIDVLAEWFEGKDIGGKRVSKNEAKKLASFVRMPISQKGGNRPFKQ